MIEFFVEGNPLPKQSFRRFKNRPGGYIDPRVVAWERAISNAAIKAMGEHEPMSGAMAVSLVFCRDNRRKCDLDNMSKAVLDGMKGICFGDDEQVLKLSIEKRYDRERPGVIVSFERCADVSGVLEKIRKAARKRNARGVRVRSPKVKEVSLD